MSNQKSVFIFSFFGFLISNFISKLLIFKNQENLPNQIFPFFNLTYQRNPGIAFGIEIQPTILLILNFLLFIAVIYLIFQKINLQNFWGNMASALILAGALGNLIERLLFASVTDFISIASFPVFNLADLYISVSVFIIILFYDKIKRNTNAHADRTKPKSNSSLF